MAAVSARALSVEQRWRSVPEDAIEATLKVSSAADAGSGRLPPRRVCWWLSRLVRVPRGMWRAALEPDTG